MEICRVECGYCRGPTLACFQLIDYAGDFVLLSYARERSNVDCRSFGLPFFPLPGCVIRVRESAAGKSIGQCHRHTQNKKISPRKKATRKCKSIKGTLDRNKKKRKKSGGSDDSRDGLSRLLILYVPPLSGRALGQTTRNRCWRYTHTRPVIPVRL